MRHRVHSRWDNILKRSSREFLIVIVMCVIVFCACGSHVWATTIYSAQNDFSLASNPNGVWSYGTTGTTLTGAFTAHATTELGISNIPNWDGWIGTVPMFGNNYPFTAKYSGATPAGETDVVILPGMLTQHPASNGGYSVVRFTAPTSGPYMLSAVFEGREFQGQGPGTNADVHVLHNSVALFNAVVIGFGPPSDQAFATSLNLTAGDRLDFSVGFGPNGTFLGDTLSLQATLTAVTVYDLKTDWSDLANPNGPWSHREGNNVLPHVADWQGLSGDFTGVQPAWARFETGSSNLPPWMKIASPAGVPTDWQLGDIVTHSTDGFNGIGSGLSNVIWTSPLNGMIDVSGGTWMVRDIGRGNHWDISLNGRSLTSGDISSGDAYNRANPFTFVAGSGGPTVLSQIPVVMGDVLRLQFTKTSTAGDYAGVNLTITTVPEVLYGATSAGQLVKINTHTGAGTLVGPIGFGTIEAIECLSDGTLVGIANANQLIKINTSTGAGQLVGTVTGYAWVEGLAYRSSDGLLYGSATVGPAADANRLITINPATGQPTSTAPSTFGPAFWDVDGLAATAFGTIYGSHINTNPSLFSVNPVSGVGTPIGTLSMAVVGMDFAADQTLYGVTIPDILNGGPSRLVSVNPANGVIQDIGPTGFNTIQAIAFGRVPECLSCPGDMDSNFAFDGNDVQRFIDCFIVAAGGVPTPTCKCADVVVDSIINSQDITEFVNRLLSPPACP